MMSQYHVITFGTAIICPAFVCAVIAAFGRRPVLKWMGYGLLAGVFGIIYLVFNAPADRQAGLPLRTTSLLVLMWGLMAFGLYQTVHGYILGQ